MAFSPTAHPTENVLWDLPTCLRKCLSFPVLLGFLLVGALCAMVLGNSMRIEPDTWWHLKLGQDILTTGHWPGADLYSFSARGTPWFDYEWLGDVALAWGYRAGGLRGLEILFWALSSTILALSYGYATLRSGNSKAAFAACALLLPVTSICFTARPQLLGYIFLLIVLICLERFRLKRQKTLWILPAIFLAWVNTHGSFSLGLALVALYFASGLVEFQWGSLHAERWTPAQRRHLGLAGLLSAAVLPLTPYGARLALFPVTVARSLPVNMANIKEWRPPDFGLWEAKLMLVLLLIYFVAQVALRLRFRLEEVTVLFAAVFLVFVHYRFVILFGIVFAPTLAAVISRWAPRYEASRDRLVLNGALMAALAAGLWTQVPSQAEMQKIIEEGYPVRAVDYIRQDPPLGNMFNAYGFGGYMVWSLGPAHPVFIDGRGDLYEKAGVFADYMHIMQIEPEMPRLLEKYKIQSCLIPPDAPLATFLTAQADWKRVYQDDVGAIFVRSSAERIGNGAMTVRDASVPVGRDAQWEASADLFPLGKELPVAPSRTREN
jgi:hypothetical protein